MTMGLAGAHLDANGFVDNETAIITNANSSTCNLSVLPYSYRWSLISIPTGSSASLPSQEAQQPAFVADLPRGTYQVALTVTDALGNVSDPAFLPVTSSTCGARAPVFTVLSAATATPNGNTADAISATVTDGDNDTAACPGFKTDITGISWSIVSAPAGSHATLASSATVPVSDNPTFPALTTPPNFVDPGNSFRADVKGSYVVRAVATASNGLSTSATLALSVAPTGCGLNAPVVTQIGAPASRPDVGSIVALTAFHTDADESASVCSPASATPRYTWSLQSAPAGSSQTSPPTPVASVTKNLASTGTVTASSASAHSVVVTFASATSYNVSVDGTPAAGGPFSGSGIRGGVGIVIGAGTFTTGDMWSFDFAESTIRFTADLAGTYVWSVVATDPFGLQSASVSVSVATGACGPTLPNATGTNEPIGLKIAGTPQADLLGGGYSVTQGAAVTLFTAALPSPGTAGDLCVTGGAAATERWTLTSAPPGSNAVLSTATGSAPGFTIDVAGTYAVQLVVTDNGGNATVFNTTISANACVSTMTPTGSFSFIATDVDPTDGTSHPATPNAGDTVQLFPQSVASTCSSSLSYEWSLISRPPGSQAALSSATAQNPLLGTDQSGVYQLGLVVRDGVGNGTVPLFYSVTTSGCGTLAPTFGASPGGVAFSATPRANADITLTAPAATDGNSSCPTRFHSTPISYAFTVVAAPIGATTSLSQNGGAIATLRVSQGAAAAGYKVQLVATDAKGRSATLPTPVGCTAPGLTATCAPAINNCGAYAPVTQQFSISQSVSGTGTQPADSLPATATTGTTAAGNQTSSKGFYFGYAVTISALTSDPDFDAAVCSGAFAVTPAQAKSTSWSLVSAPAGSHATIGANTGSSIVFTPDVAGGPYKLAMTTSDSTGNSDVSTITFSLGCGGNSPSIASSSGSQTPAYTGGFAVGQAVR
ncbi:MAG: hypothetical protein E6J88_16540, partial [Deltaproteobacteria bacterium]